MRALQATLAIGFMTLNGCQSSPAVTPDTVSEKEQIHRSIEDGVTDGGTLQELTAYTPEDLPSFIAATQVASRLTKGLVVDDPTLVGPIFITALQSNANYAVELPATEDQWAGVLVKVGNTAWHPLFEIHDVPDPETPGHVLKPNVVNVDIVPSDTGPLLQVLTVDDRGAGSGEGILARYVSADYGRTWIPDGCFYYIPEEFPAMSPSTGCVY